MSPVESVAIEAFGMVTPVGFNGPASCAAMRAGVRNVNETNLWDAASGTYLAAGRVLLPHWWIGTGKLAELATPAIAECVAAAAPETGPGIPVFLGVSAPTRPHRYQDLDSEILPEIEHRLGFALHPSSRVIARDRVSIVVALRDAASLLSRGTARACVVAAVDSLVQQELAVHYIARHRLLTKSNSNGFSLGEAAGAVLVTSPRKSGRDQLVVTGTGLTREAATIESDLPLRGEGLVEALGAAFSESRLSIADMHYRIGDLNGEHYRFKEMVLAMLRYERTPKPKLFELWHPIEYIGDVGAAIGPIVLGVALDAARKGYATGPNVLCTFGNDDGERAALVASFRARR